MFIAGTFLARIVPHSRLRCWDTPAGGEEGGNPEGQGVLGITLLVPSPASHPSCASSRQKQHQRSGRERVQVLFTSVKSWKSLAVGTSRPA